MNDLSTAEKNAENTQRYLSFLQMSEHDLSLLTNLHKVLQGTELGFIDPFYTHLFGFEETRPFLSDPEQVKRLKNKQKAYFERLLTGKYDADYINDRVNIGKTHQKSGIKPQWYIGAYQFYLSWLFGEIQQRFANDNATAMASMLAVLKVVLFDIELVIEAYFQSDHDMLRLLAQVFESNIEGVLITDVKGRIAHVNKKVSQIVGYTQSDLQGQPVTLLLAQSERDIFSPRLDTIRKGESWQGETWLQHIHGNSFPAWVNISGVLDDSGNVTHYVIEFSDISAYHAAQETLRQRTEELARSNKELEQFAYVASHDLQEPLRMVASFTQLLARRYEGKLDADANEFIHYAVDGATRMQTLINDLLTYSRVGTRVKPFAAVDLNEVLNKAKDNLRLAIESNQAQIQSEALPEVQGDATQLLQLFQNLIGNAIKFSGNKQADIQITTKLNGQFWDIEVCDNGIGIAPEFFDRIFIIFQRLHNKEDYPGTGIGLAICKKIVERHGGQIRVQSEPGQGATFIVTFPIVEEHKL